MARSNLFLRVLSAIILIPIALLIIFKGNIEIFFIVISIICIGSLLEYLNIIEMKAKIDKLLSSIFAILILFIFVFYENYLAIILSAYLCIFLTYVLFKYGTNEFVCRAGANILGMIYFPVLLGFTLKIFFFEKGNYWIFMLLVLNWLTDSFAYFVGISFGKHHFTEISPKKTVEGLFGGVLGGILSVLLINYFFIKSDKWIGIILLGFLGSVFGQLGDLFESGIKRSFGVKDSGSIIPGHGGFMDRFDSLFFTGPLFYFFIKFYIKGY
ncbi:MAG: phosphatidate cytidylyltransferase [Proteobacteria bacterium]|nr:phosphatidate cytidylyltransferase [Pseudomonadota bacterium]